MTAQMVSIYALCLMFVVATIWPVNMGVLAFVGAFLVGTLAAGMSSKDIIAGFPGSLFLTLVGITFLFAIAQNNGTVRLAVKAVRGRIGRHGTTESAADTLVVDGLRVEYGGRGWWPGRPGRTFRAVDDVSFSVEPGEIFGLVGESGCGKTTVANTIAGLIRPDAGTVRLGGEPIWIS